MKEWIKEISFTVLITSGAFIVAGIMLFTIYFFSQKRIEECWQDPRSCKTVNELKCEDVGGIYYRGVNGIFSASTSNCIFPPK